MATDAESFNRDLYDLLKVRGYHPVPLDSKNQRVNAPQNADVIQFVFTKDGKEYGKVWISIDKAKRITLYYDNEQEDSPNDVTPGVEYDDTWTGLLKNLKKWAMRRQLDFDLENKDRLGDDMRQREHYKMKEKLGEGYHSMGKKASYNDGVPNVKIVLQHTRQIEEGEQRFRNVARIFVENTNGERFLLPTTRPGIARVYARHIAEGGTPYDERGKHITSLVEEYNQMAGFVRATRNGQFNESTQSLVNEGTNHYTNLRETLSKMTGLRGYNNYFESWTPSLMEDEGDNSAINELFVQETLDPRIESVMPILSRLHKKVNEMQEVNELASWADSIANNHLEEALNDAVPEPYKKAEMQDYKTQRKQSLATTNPDLAKDEKLGEETEQEYIVVSYSKPEGIKVRASSEEEALKKGASILGVTITQVAVQPAETTTSKSKSLYDPSSANDALERAKLKAHNKKKSSSNFWKSVLNLPEGEENKEETHDDRHGGPYDRGSADSYYRRGYRPHYYVGATQMSDKVDKDQMTPEEIKAYKAGYNNNEEQGDFKQWNEDKDNGHTEEENDMAQDNLHKMAKASGKLEKNVKKMGDKNSLEPWQQQLIATAADKVDAVYHSKDDDELDEELEPWMGKDLETPAYLRKREHELNKRDAEGGGPGLRRVKNDPDEEIDEDLDANQKRAGQLGPTEKVGPKGAVGKLVGANESVDSELARIRKLSGL